MKKPILVTGSHRSGTTWVGRMISLDRDVGYIHEPFNIDLPPGYNKLKLNYWFTNINSNYPNEENIKSELTDILNFKYQFYEQIQRGNNFKDFLRIGRELSKYLENNIYNRRPLIKDPIAIMSAEWLYKTFDMNVIVLIRHPASFVSSLKRLGWKFQFSNLLKQKELMTEKLYPFNEEIENFTIDEKNIIDQAILLWRIIYYVVKEYRKKYPNWIFKRHEDLANNPVEEFRDIYKKIGLNYTKSIENKITKYSSLENPNEVTFKQRDSIKRNSKSQIAIFKKRLSTREINYIKEKTKDVWIHFYNDLDW
jgi:hypothetical protein